jgi:hypothetical protein
MYVAEYCGIVWPGSSSESFLSTTPVATVDAAPRFARRSVVSSVVRIGISPSRAGARASLTSTVSSGSSWSVRISARTKTERERALLPMRPAGPVRLRRRDDLAKLPCRRPRRRNDAPIAVACDELERQEAEPDEPDAAARHRRRLKSPKRRRKRPTAATSETIPTAAKITPSRARSQVQILPPLYDEPHKCGSSYFGPRKLRAARASTRV